MRGLRRVLYTRGERSICVRVFGHILACVDVQSESVTRDSLRQAPLDALVDYREEYDRLTKEKKKLEGEVARVNGKLSNQGFVSKAPEKVINEEKAKKEMYEEMLAKVTAQLESVSQKIK